MDEKIMKFLRKNNIHISNIKYLLRQANKTCIYMTDGRVVKTFITVKDLYEILIPYDCISINEGTVVSRGQINLCIRILPRLYLQIFVRVFLY